MYVIMLLTFAVAFSAAAGVLLAYWLFVILNAILQELFGK